MLPILFITLVRGDAGSALLSPAERICVFCGSRATADAVLNALLFLPLGWVLGRRKGVRRTMGAALLLSLVLETAQLFLVGRFTSLVDVLANASGAGAGAWLARGGRGVRGGSLSLALLALLAPALLLAPAPPEGTYFGQWMAVFGHMEAYEGRILHTWVDDVPVFSRRSPDTEEIRGSLREGTPIRVSFLVGPPPPGPAPVFSIFDDRRRGIFMLGVDGEDVFVRLWRRGTSLRLSTPTWWWKDGLAGLDQGDSTQVVFEIGEKGPCLSVQGRNSCLTTMTSVGSWSLLAPGGQEGPWFQAGALIWAILLGGLVGMIRSRLLWRIVLVAGIGGAVAGVSWTLPYWPTPWTGILFLLLGTLLGSLLPSHRKRERMAGANRTDRSQKT